MNTPKISFPPTHIVRHSIESFGPKRNEYALVLNVLNEGERLANQLRRLSPYRSCVDIVVSDAPSSDGSTAADRLREAGVTTLISLLEPGRYSASALAAFAYCRTCGYQGVILMDGNDKDDLVIISECRYADKNITIQSLAQSENSWSARSQE